MQSPRSLAMMREPPAPKKAESVFSRLTSSSSSARPASVASSRSITADNSQVSPLSCCYLLDGSRALNLFYFLLIQSKRRSLFGDASKDITKSLAKKFDSSTLGRRPVESDSSSSLKRSSSIRTTTADKPRSSFYTPMPESSTIPERTMTLGRASSFRVNNRTPAVAPATTTNPSASSDKKSSSSGGYTTSLMNWRPFRKSRDETSDTGGSSSRKTSLTGGGTLGRTGSSRTGPLSSNTLGASNSSLKRSTSSVASTVPNKSAYSSSTNVQLLPSSTQRSVPSSNSSTFLSRSNSVRTPSAAPAARASVKGTTTFVFQSSFSLLLYYIILLFSPIQIQILVAVPSSPAPVRRNNASSFIRPTASSVAKDTPVLVKSSIRPSPLTVTLGSTATPQRPKLY